MAADARRYRPGNELDDLAYQAAADALIAITGKLGQFRGESLLARLPTPGHQARMAVLKSAG